MTFNYKIYIQLKITKRTRLFFISSNIRKNIKDYNKKENKKRNTTNYRDKTNIKKRCTRESCIKISKKTINISKR